MRPRNRSTLQQGLAALYEQTAQRVRDGVRSAATLDMQQAHGRWLVAELGPRRRLAAIDETTLERLTAPRVPPRRFGVSTLRKRLSTLQQLLKLAHRRRWVTRVPAFPALIVPWRPGRRFLETFEEARRIAAKLPQHRADWFWLVLLTGQHVSDAERMTWNDLSQLHSRSGSTMLIRNTKNRKVAGVRVPIPRHLVAVLRACWKRARPKPGDRLVLPWPSRKHTLPLGVLPPGGPAGERDRPAPHVRYVDGAQAGNHPVGLRLVRAQQPGDDGQDVRPCAARAARGVHRRTGCDGGCSVKRGTRAIRWFMWERQPWRLPGRPSRRVRLVVLLECGHLVSRRPTTQVQKLFPGNCENQTFPVAGRPRRMVCETCVDRAPAGGAAAP